MKKIFFTGAVPSVQHGVAVNGLDDRELKFLQRQALKAEPPTCAGTSRTLKLALHDPIWKLSVAPILMHAQIVWIAVATPLQARIDILTLLKWWKVAKPCQVLSWK